MKHKHMSTYHYKKAFKAQFDMPKKLTFREVAEWQHKWELTLRSVPTDRRDEPLRVEIASRHRAVLIASLCDLIKCSGEEADAMIYV